MSRRQIVVKATRSRPRSKPRRRPNHMGTPACACLATAFLVPGDGVGFGVGPHARKLRHLVLHLQTGYCVDPARGQVYGRSGEPIGAICADGYIRLHGVAATAHTLYAHRLVWEVCNGPIPDGFHVDHKNAIRSDNRSRNLQAVTPSRNASLVFERGGRLPGEAMSHSKLDEEKVRQIRSSGLKHFSNPELARMFGVDTATLRSAREGRTWKHVKRRRSSPHRSKRKD